MKVYAVIMRCEDNFYSDYTIADDCVYLKEEDAERRLNEMVNPEQFEIYDFEVKE